MLRSVSLAKGVLQMYGFFHLIEGSNIMCVLEKFLFGKG